VADAASPEMEELIKSPVADLKNTGGRFGGSINAALFLQHFVGKVPWAHLDIAGPASIDKERGYNARAAPARACACWRSGSGAAARPLLRRGLRLPRAVEGASV